jgi:hypothetical protein
MKYLKKTKPLKTNIRIFLEVIFKEVKEKYLKKIVINLKKNL